MNQPSRLLEWIVWGGLALIISAIVVAFVAAELKKPSGSGPLPVLGTVEHFALTNQFGETITADNLRGRLWIADIIFTLCPTMCVKMTREMSALQTSLPASSGVELISLTAHPEHDLPDVLKKYGQKYGADFARWHFLTGTRSNLYRLAIEDLLLAVAETTPESRENENDLFIHSTKFVLVDGRGQVRGVFEGTEPASRRQILDAVRALQKER